MGGGVSALCHLAILPPAPGQTAPGYFRCVMSCVWSCLLAWPQRVVMAHPFQSGPNAHIDTLEALFIAARQLTAEEAPIRRVAGTEALVQYAG